MRIRAARVSLAFVLAAATAIAGVAASHPGVRSVMRPVIGTAAAPAQAAIVGLASLHGHHPRDRVTAVDVVLSPAILLAMLLLVAVVVRRFRPPLRLATSATHARGPPAMR
jgi:hypothetical protein